MPAGTITALRAQAKDSQRVNVFVDGEFAIGISLTTLSRERLFVGKPITEEEYARLEASEQIDKAFSAALRALESRQRSTAELRDRLRRKEFPPLAIDAAIEKLERLNLIDDEAFAKQVVEQRQTMQSRGAGAIRNELRRKGVDKDVIDTLLNTDETRGGEAGRAMAAARKAFPKYASAPDRQTFLRRMGGFLQRRGFSFDVIRPILDQLWMERTGEQPADDDDSI